jgi:hypothetical protein
MVSSEFTRPSRMPPGGLSDHHTAAEATTALSSCIRREPAGHPRRIARDEQASAAGTVHSNAANGTSGHRLARMCSVPLRWHQRWRRGTGWSRQQGSGWCFDRDLTSDTSTSIGGECTAAGAAAKQPIGRAGAYCLGDACLLYQGDESHHSLLSSSLISAPTSTYTQLFALDFRDISVIIAQMITTSQVYVNDCLIPLRRLCSAVSLLVSTPPYGWGACLPLSPTAWGFPSCAPCPSK